METSLAPNEPVVASTMEELHNAMSPDLIAVVQFSAPWCTRCPTFTEAMRQLKRDYQFIWVYAELPDAEELKEEFEITKLPALVLLSKDHETHKQVALLQSSTPQDASKAVLEHCPPSFVLDADF